MAEIARSKDLTLPVAPLAAGVIAVLTAAMFALLPTDLLEAMAVDSGIATLVPAAQPPLGFTAQMLLVLACSVAIGLIGWFALFLMFGTRTMVVRRGAGDANAAPVRRRADAHPDAPPRRPLFANTDLGTPFLDVRAQPGAGPESLAPPAERPLPVDLNEPLAAYDPAAVAHGALEWGPPPRDLEPPAQAPDTRRPPYELDERMATVPPTPMIRAGPDPVPPSPPIAASAPSYARADPADTIESLLDRLERLTARDRRAAAPDQPTVLVPVPGPGRPSTTPPPVSIAPQPTPAPAPPVSPEGQRDRRLRVLRRVAENEH